MRIYVASSWRNPLQPSVVELLRLAEHEVYDFRNPAPGNHGFHWSEVYPVDEGWHPEPFRRALAHPISQAGFHFDFSAMQWAEAGILVLPSGRSSHLELGWMAGKGKRTAVLLAEPLEPELMYLCADLVAVTIEEILEWAQEPP